MRPDSINLIAEDPPIDASFEALAVDRSRAAESELKYLSFLSHDLNNNLSAIHLHLQLLKERLVRSPEFAQDLSALDLVEQSVKRTTDAMQRLLTRERLRKQQIEPLIQSINLRQLTDSIAAPMRFQAVHKGLELSVEIRRNLIVHTDGDLIALVLQNLIGNAVKYSHRGTVRVHGRWARGPGGERCVISVCDEGPGIPPRHLAMIFDAFWRGEVRGNEGIGLGLAIAAEAAKLLGAELSVESELGVGTSFHLALPPRGARN